MISRALLVSSVLLVFGLIASCGKAPDFERVRDTTNPVSWAYGWFVDEALDLATGDLSESIVLGQFPCFKFTDPTFDLDDQDAEEAFRSACQRLDNAVDKHVGLSREWQELSNLEQEDFASEVDSIVEQLHHALVCGRGNEWFSRSDDSFGCRKQQSSLLPFLTFAVLELQSNTSSST